MRFASCRQAALIAESTRDTKMALLLCVIFFFSGTAGVIFETLWFRAAGLTLGNSFSASSIVLASFMAGLAAGNALAGHYGKRLRRPLQLYAIIEVIVGLTGIAIVVLLPSLSPTLGRLFTHTLAQTWLVNLLRLTVAFSLMLVPATAMGFTLPLLAKAVTGSDLNFGRVLGRLYGWNTLGGMAGAFCVELWLIGWLGQRGTALAAGALNLAAAAVALLLARRPSKSMTAAPETPSPRPLSIRSWRLLAAAFLAGATLLALEVVWFRFLQLFVFGTSFIFAAMLAAILLGIGGGGVLAARWLGRDPQAHRFAPIVALAAGVAVELSYATFEPGVGRGVYITGNTAAALSLFLRLMLPTSFLSGVLFTLLGAAQRQECGEAAEAAGRLTFANTLGAMVGSLLAGFVLLPHLGMENALFASMLSYGLIACLATVLPAAKQMHRYRHMVVVAAFALFALAGALYPFGLMGRHFIPLVTARYTSADSKLLAVHEGMTETVMYLRSSFRGQPIRHRLMTNGHSMSATTLRGLRYMKLYAYWALAVNPSTRNALLISYGIGSTAKALTDTRQLESIDVVDISPDILKLGSLAFPDTRPPLDDPRVRVHVEDGRFFLQTTDERFDLITAEPPPVRGAGINSLYSREYFQLIRDRLRDGGVVTYWLPVNQLWLSETKAIMRGFCDAFPDCSLWSGAGLQWMLAGTRGARGPVSEEQFSAQWRDPVVGPELADLGLEAPESLGATFLAGSVTLGEWTHGSLPLDDDHPGRILAHYPPGENGDPIYRSWMEPRAIRQRFESSTFIRDIWPPELRHRTAEYFAPQAVFDDLCVWRRYNPIQALHGVLTLSSLRTLPLLLMGTEPAVQRIAMSLYDGGLRDADLEFEIGVRAMSERDYEGAAQHLALVTGVPGSVSARFLRTLALALLGKEAEAAECLNSVDRSGLAKVDTYLASWLERFLQGRQHRSGDGVSPARSEGPFSTSITGHQEPTR
jgi:predicted membrane-bound spermidine synthase